MFGRSTLRREEGGRKSVDDSNKSCCGDFRRYGGAFERFDELANHWLRVTKVDWIHGATLTGFQLKAFTPALTKMFITLGVTRSQGDERWGGRFFSLSAG